MAGGKVVEGNARRVLVVTVVHHPDDARIRHRQIAALLKAGWQVTYAAPWTDYGLVPNPAEGLAVVDVRRARGRGRLASQVSARSVLREFGPMHDVVILHDPELVPTTMGMNLPPVVWDVHEDPAAAVMVRAWLPRVLRRPAAAAIRAVERLAESRLSLFLADAQYSSRFSGSHIVVPNSTWVPSEPAPAAVRGSDGVYRVVYLGSVAPERGAAELVEVGRRLHQVSEGALRLEVMGPAHGTAAGLMRSAHQRGDLVWSGFLRNEEALARVRGALAGLSLLRDVANFHPSMPTKIIEYLAQGVPVITTPLPLAADLVMRADAGLVVPFGDVDEVASRVVAALSAWADEPTAAVAAGRRGHAYVLAEWNWSVHGSSFVAALESIVERAERGRRR